MASMRASFTVSAMSQRPAWAATVADECRLPGSRMLADRGPDLPDWCDPLDDPRWVTPARATLMRDDDAVLGFEALGRRWAIPWWVMKNHHVANLTLEGEPFLVTLCEACVAGGIFDPVLADHRFRFQTSGSYQSSPLMTDDLTGGLWALVNGRRLTGPELGVRQLPMRPILHFPWKEWRALYPDTLVVHGPDEPRDGHGSSFYGAQPP